MNLNSIKSNDVNFANWEFDDAQAIKFTRTKKILIEKELKEDITVYLLGTNLGEGGGSSVHSLIPNNPAKKIKAVKIKHGGKRVDLSKEFVILSILPKSEGLSLPPKGFTEGCIILAKYDCTLESILNKMTPKMKIEAIKQLVNGLLSLHETGICHSDIRPRNIMCRTRNDKTRFDLIDFDEAWAYGKVTANKFNNDIFDEKQFLKDMQKDITWLGYELYNIVLGKIVCDRETVTYEFVNEMGLPASFADLINYMCNSRNNKKDMKIAKQMMQS